MERRLSKLYHADYLSWPSDEQYKNHPIPESICWLGWRGALYVAGSYGVNVVEPERAIENQFRELEKDLRERGIYWVREPRWSLLRHDLSVADFRFAVEREISTSLKFGLDNWLSEMEFRSDPDVVMYTTKDRNDNVRHRKKRILPDAYFEILDIERRKRGEDYRARLLLELDMSTHSNPRFGREKVAPGVAYIKCGSYKKRFGYNSGHWLVVTSGGKRRMKNLMRHTEEYAGDDAEFFLFANFDKLVEGYPLSSPIWMKVGQEHPVPILNY
jgi:hypothetical protein